MGSFMTYEQLHEMLANYSRDQAKLANQDHYVLDEIHDDIREIAKPRQNEKGVPAQIPEFTKKDVKQIGRLQANSVLYVKSEGHDLLNELSKNEIRQFRSGMRELNKIILTQIHDEESFDKQQPRLEDFLEVDSEFAAKVCRGGNKDELYIFNACGGMRNGRLCLRLGCKQGIYFYC